MILKVVKSRRSDLWGILLAGCLIFTGLILTGCGNKAVEDHTAVSAAPSDAAQTQSLEETPAPTEVPTPTSTPSPTPEPTPYDITGNGTVDEVDEYLFSLWQDGPIATQEELEETKVYFENSLLGEKFYDKFCYTGEESGDGYYRNGYVSMSLTEGEIPCGKRITHYYLADIYIRDLSCLRTYVVNPTLKKYSAEEVGTMAAEQDAVIAISGDFCSARTEGLCLRNGEWLRTSKDKHREVGVLYYDGVLETYKPKEVDMDAINARGAWQVWGFGPGLLDEDGKARESFISTVTNFNPRSAIGYYEPGHYCFFVCEGRGVNTSLGLKMVWLAQFFEELGCKQAYNFDGGATAIMADATHEISVQSQRRAVSDMIYIAKYPEGAGAAADSAPSGEEVADDSAANVADDGVDDAVPESAAESPENTETE